MEVKGPRAAVVITMDLGWGSGFHTYQVTWWLPELGREQGRGGGGRKPKHSDGRWYHTSAMARAACECDGLELAARDVGPTSEYMCRMPWAASPVAVPHALREPTASPPARTRRLPIAGGRAPPTAHPQAAPRPIIAETRMTVLIGRPQILSSIISCSGSGAMV